MLLADDLVERPRAHARGERRVGSRRARRGRAAGSPASKSWSIASSMAVARSRRVACADGRPPAGDRPSCSSALDPLQHGQPARQRARRPRSCLAGVPATTPASRSSCSAAPSERPNLVARLRGDGDGPTLCLLSHVDTVLADPGDWHARPVVGRRRRRRAVGPRRAGHEVADRGRGRRPRSRSRARAGGPRAATCSSSCVVDEETGGARGRAVALRAPPRHASAATTLLNEGAGPVIPFDGERYYGVCVAEKGVFRFTLTTDGVAGHASMPEDRRQRAAEDGAAARGACGDAPAGVRRHRRAARLLDGLGVDARRRPGAALERAARSATRAWPCCVEPMLGVTLAPTRDPRLGEDQRDPVARASSRSTAACRRASARTRRCRAHPRGARRATATSSSSSSRSSATARRSTRR